ncbi:hypothetical protein F4778DRAFT_742023 [Xylariomycetidae sp. FL2044]|nr:hypothetical protein F4778DRAFT_742023 [Xylariomycetidae sp. FL2044]
MESPPTSDVFEEFESFDSSKPFHGLVLCCTSIEADQRSEIAQRTADMGGVHKYDLTPDVTHLIVGDYNTAKYRHVAKERPDIKPMAAGWVDAVRALWVNDGAYDFVALENEWTLRTLESSGGIPNSPVKQERERTRLICCLTGFEDHDVRAMIEDKVKDNGGEYTGDLSKRVTHLIVNRPEGKKYIAAKKWGLRTVSVEWLHDSVDRGMILNEDCYDPTLPQDERGKGAWTRKEIVKKVSLGKRSRDAAAPAAQEGRRKLRKTASMKLNSQRENLWGDILVNQSSADLSKAAATIIERSMSVPNPPAVDSPATEVSRPQFVRPNKPAEAANPGGVFSLCRFYVHGFPPQKERLVHDFLSSHGGQISSSLADAGSLGHGEPLHQRYLVVPQTSQPDTHPKLPEGIRIVTEFFIERCIHNKKLFSPDEHVLGQPFPKFPIEGFENLTIATSGFVNEQLNQMQKAVVQLGANYAEVFSARCSLLVCPSLEKVRKQKLQNAVLFNIPVIDAEWLWQCIRSAYLIPWDKFALNEAGQNQSLGHADDNPPQKKKEALQRSRSEPAPRKTKPRHIAPPAKAGVDMTAFEEPDPVPVVEREEPDDSHYETALTHQVDNGFDDSVPAPLSERNGNALNKSPSSPKAAKSPESPKSPRKLRRYPTGATVGDSEDSDATTGGPRSIRNTVAPTDEEAQRKRKAEEERAQRRKQEQQELARRLESLTSHPDGASDGDALKLKPQPGSKPLRRKREILGRAASGASAASSASADSSSKPGIFGSGGTGSAAESRKASASAATEEHESSDIGRLDSMMLREETEIANSRTEGAAGDPAAPEDADNPPRSTQLEYDNPEARKHRAAIMDRMMGNKRESEGAGGGSGGRRSQEKVTMSDLKVAEKTTEGAAAASTTTTTTRRTTRRRPGF